MTSRYLNQLKGKSSAGAGGNRNNKNSQANLAQTFHGDSIDEKFGFVRYINGPPKIGWMLNYIPVVK